MSTWLPSIRLLRHEPSITAAVCALMFLALTGCEPHRDSPHPLAHDCPRNANSDWGDVPGMTLEHFDPRLCPLSVQTSQPLTVGGTVIERGAEYPHNGDLVSMELNVWANYDVVLFSGWNQLADESRFFAWETPDDIWSAQISLTYNFGNNPNWMEFHVGGFISGLPRAYIELNNGDPE